MSLVELLIIALICICLGLSGGFFIGWYTERKWF